MQPNLNRSILTLPMTDRPYKLGVALSGGGARGFAHAGALQALEEVGLRPDIIAGVSAGSVISAFYAAGVVPSLMPTLFANVKFKTCCELTANKGGLFKIDKFETFLDKSLRGHKLLEDLKIPTYICATDIDHGVPVAFNSGPIAKRVAASCSIPILFSPIVIDGVAYVDGGVLRNLPAWAIRDKCEQLIGINCSPLVHDSKRKNSIVDIAHRTYRLMAKTNALSDMAMCDLVVETKDIAHYKVFNMKEIEMVYQSGYQCAMDSLRKNGWI